MGTTQCCASGETKCYDAESSHIDAPTDFPSCWNEEDEEDVAMDEQDEDSKVYWIRQVRQRPFQLNHVPSWLKVDRDIIIAAVEVRGRALRMAPAELRDDKEVVLLAVQRCGSAIEFASERLRGDVQVAEAAVQNPNCGGPEALRFVRPPLNADPWLRQLSATMPGRPGAAAAGSTRSKPEAVQRWISSPGGGAAPTGQGCAPPRFRSSPENQGLGLPAAVATLHGRRP